MQVVAERGDDPQAGGSWDDKQDYVPLMLQAMGDHAIGLRALALKTGIGKSRLGLLLHRNPAKRSAMTLVEFQRILDALDMDLIEAVVSIEILQAARREGVARHRRLVGMLCAMFRDLPANLIAELDEVDGIDGTEVRPEWAPVLQRAVIKRLVHEIAAVVSRRTTLSEFSIFN